MAKKETNKKEELFLQLGKNDYKVGKQAELCGKATERLRILQAESNRIATEIEKLDG